MIGAGRGRHTIPSDYPPGVPLAATGRRALDAIGAIANLRPSPALLSPIIAFPALWALAVALAQIHVVSIQEAWSTTVWWVVALVPMAFVAGGLLATSVVRLTVQKRDRPADRAVVVRRRVLVGLLLVGYAALAREFAQAGVVPLLSGHIDQTRVSLQSSGAAGLLSDALNVAAIVAIASPRDLRSGAALPEVVIAALALAGTAAAGGRQAFVIVAAGLIARALYRGTPKLRSLLGVLFIGVGLFALVFYIRTGQETVEGFNQQFYGHVVSGTFAPLVPLLPVDLSLSVNLDVLAHVVGYFPHSMPFGHGEYDAWAIHSLVHARRLQSLTAQLTPPWVVSTVAGPLWADGGLAVVTVGCLLIGALTTVPFAVCRRTHRFSHTLIAGYAVSVALYLVYDNLITQLKDWVVVAPALLVVGWMAERRGAAERPTAADTGAAEHLLGRRRRLEPALTVSAASCAALAIWAVVVAAAMADVNTVKAQLTSAAATLSAPVPGPGWVPLGSNASARPLVLGPHVRQLLADQLATDSAPAVKPVIWAFGQHAQSVAATALSVAGGHVTAMRTVRFNSGVHGAIVYAVARWGHSGPAAFVLSHAGDSVAVRVVSLGTRPHLLAVGRTPPIPTTRLWPRNLAIAPSGGSFPNLVVVDRGGGNGRLHIHIFSGASGFSREVLDSKPNVIGFPAADWRLGVGQVQDRGDDLVFLGDALRTPASKLQVHVLLASSGYERFDAQTQFDVRLRGTQRLQFLIGPTVVQPLLYVVDPVRGEIIEVVYT